MLKAFREHIELDFPELLTDHFLIACSGGLDSVVLCVLCKELGLQFSMAHCNFGLRGHASDGDEDFVRSLAKSLNSQIFVTRFDTLGYVNQHKVSMQMACRELRYAWFRKILGEQNISLLLTAHHANDNLETFLINLSRGSGIEGLTGIPAKTTYLRRPLLPFTREQLASYAQDNAIRWREDSSNADTKYLRNKIRIDLVPILKELHPTFSENFKNTLRYLEQTNTIANAYLEELKKELFVPQGNGYQIPIIKLKKLHPLSTYLHGLFYEYGFRELDNLESILDGISGKFIRSNTHILVKNREFLLLSHVQTHNDKHSYDIREDAVVVKHPVSLKFSEVSQRYDNSRDIIYVQKNTLKYPLTLRKWKKGDYFYPIGLNGKKKLAKFFKDEKLDILSKENIWLLCSQNQIVWVVGMRADNRFKVVDNAQKILKIEIT
ncbi:tRNA lysidine(34) synthetase TilS [Maribacter sp. MAR_2009_72]|uniref:tRNA lysidine(34) synthetase TilS n=1 Tax=Maribacter sp. MAR_2009_72 TaxID=1250050 RepID=UPI00119B10B8|nr:tRNA lysidine(34) synthetase TilS [Maribacter sp. MAR_2009_72]TVZ14008.1 tRNA(Ile)-lysidine synthase [Maribacter sp. MAR_2009_72]